MTTQYRLAQIATTALLMGLGAMSAAKAANLAPGTGIALATDVQYPYYQDSNAAYSSQPQQYFMFTGLIDNVLPGDTLVTSPHAMPGGLTSGSLELTNTSYGNLSEASASLADGTVRAAADAGAASTADTTARDVDYVMFHVANGGTAQVDVHVHLDGAEMGAGFDAGSYSADLAFALGDGAFDYSSYISNNGNSGFGYAGSSGYAPPRGWDSYSFSNGSLESFDFNGVLDVYDGQNAGLFMSLNLFAQNSVTANFLNTARVSLTLPSNVTITSGSGVLFSGQGVPEPASWAVMLVGFGGVGAVLRGRRRPRIA